METIRSHKEFERQMKEAHWCEECDGKIFCIQLDNLGLTHCAYCGKIVDYPKATNEEVMRWIEESKETSHKSSKENKK